MKKLIPLIFILIPNIIFSQSNFYPPKVEIDDYTLNHFLTELTIATGKKDKAFILDHMSPQILNSFGGDGGIDEFKSLWDFDKADSDFWKVLERILLIGGSTYEKGSNRYSIPYVFSDWAQKVSDYDVFDYSLIIGTNVNVRDKPNIKNSKIVGQLNYDLIKVDYDKSYESKDQQQQLERNYLRGPSWYYVCSQDNKVCGFVYWKYVASPISYRMGFEKKNGKWFIAYFVAGD